MQLAGSSTSNLTDLLPGLTSLWSESTGSPGICIAVLDGPVDLSHPCFSGAQLYTRELLVPCVADAGPASGHGTHVASIIFGQHSGPVRGLVPRCRGLIIPVFSTSSEGNTQACSQLDLARAISHAVAEGAHIINVSAGQLAPGGEPEDHLARAVRLCAENGVLIVAAAGNDGCECLHVPAALPSVLAVGAQDAQGKPLEASNWGGPYQLQGILSPGENILGANPEGGVSYKTGTSFATPVVSGIAALLLSIQLEHGHKPDPLAIREALLRSATPCEPGGASECNRFLAGQINLLGARKLLGVQRGAKPALNVAEVGASVLVSPPVRSVASLAGLDEIRPSSASEEARFSELPNLLQGEFTHVPDERPDVQNESAAPTLPSGPPADKTTAAVTTSGISPSDCGCGGSGGKCSCGGGGGKLPLVYALGELGYDFGTEARKDSFAQAGANLNQAGAGLLAHLSENPASASAIIWTLTQDTTPIYAVQPVGPFAANTYQRLRDFLNAQLTEGVERISVPGIIAGKVTLLNGQAVEVIIPEYRGMYSWSTPKLVEAVAGPKLKGKDAEDTKRHQQKSADVSNFLERVYYEVRNLGVAPSDRAKNYAATNAFQVERVFQSAITTDFNRDGKPDDMKLESITAERSPICRPGSDCWDVKLTFFNPAMRFEQAKHVYRFTVDVSDVIPVTVGKVRDWDVY